MTESTTTVTAEDVGESLRRISIHGRLDAIGLDEVSRDLAEFASAPMKGVVVDLTQVPFLASAGIGHLISTAQAVKARGGFMTLLAMRGSSVMTSLEMVGIAPLIPVFDNPSAAYTSALRGW